MGFSTFLKKSLKSHFDLSLKALDKGDFLKWKYHDSVIEEQKKLNKVLNRTEREQIYKNVYRFKH